MKKDYIITATVCVTILVSVWMIYDWSVHRVEVAGAYGIGKDLSFDVRHAPELIDAIKMNKGE